MQNPIKKAQEATNCTGVGILSGNSTVTWSLCISLQVQTLVEALVEYRH